MRLFARRKPLRVERNERREGRASGHRIKISNRRATQRCNVSSFFYAKICSLLARRRSSQPVQRVYWPGNVIDWLGKWRPTCVMRHARGQKLHFYMDLYSMLWSHRLQIPLLHFSSDFFILACDWPFVKNMSNRSGK
jgi:hypothetical protein